MMTENTNRVIPAVALRGLVILPDMIIHFDLSRKFSIKAVEHAMMEEEKIFLVTQKETDQKEPDYDHVYHAGTIASIKQVIKLPGNIVRVLVEGEERAKLNAFESAQGYYVAHTEPIMTLCDMDEVEMAAGSRLLKELAGQVMTATKRGNQPFMNQIADMEDLEKMMDIIAMNLPLPYAKKQEFLELVSLRARYEKLSFLLQNEVEINKVRNELATEVKSRIDKNQKNYMLREQMNYIREELGEDELSEAEQFEESLKKLEASDQVREKIQKEINRFKNVSHNSSESAVERAYIETLLEMPWDKRSEDREDLGYAKEVLKQEHYGMEKVKERIMEFLAVRALKNQNAKEQGRQVSTSSIICLVGPPGTGKTSVAKSVAKALDKEYVRICLGGVRDEAEIRGHRKTYIGAMPGRIANGLKQAGVKNPLILLDEIDKMSSDYKGDTSSAMLEVLDSEQNSHFRDHYLEIPIDLSEVLFIATANDLTKINGPLRDRMEIIELNSYTSNEKFHIAKEHLLKKQLKANGLKAKQLTITDKALEKIILSYTREAGVRECERKIGELCRKAALELLTEKEEKVKISGSNLKEYLGKEKYAPDKAADKPQIGIVRGLAWTSVGGDTLEIEVNIMPGKGEVSLTGQLGDVMKESAMTGISYIRSISDNYGVKPEYFKEHDIHIHIPEGAVPKDGPSAGVTMATAVLSAITERKIRADVAMTGEITLRGRVLAIGGLKEKTLAAKTAGIKTVIVPVDNKKDMDEIEAEIKEGLQIVYASQMKDVIRTAFVNGE